MRGFEAVERGGQLVDAEPSAVSTSVLGGLRVLDQVAVEALAVADGRLEADGVLDELEQLLDALGRKPASAAISSVVGSRFSFWARCGACASPGAPARRRARAAGSSGPGPRAPA